MFYAWDIIGHRRQLEQLEQDLEHHRISHAYLFSGPKQIGKFSIARIFATLLQCPHGFCKTCKDCKAIAAGVHPDTFLFPDEGESLSIDGVRKVIEKANLMAQGNYRIFVIQAVERMPLEAQNSFLKILEEPPGKTIFILTSSRINEVLPTLQSRVRHIEFYNVSDDHLKDYLKKRFSARADLDEIINMAQGRPGLAISLMEDMALLSEQRTMYRHIERFLKENNVVEKFLWVEELVEELPDSKDRVEFFFDAFTRYLRKLLFEYMEGGDHPLRSRFDLKALVELFESLEKTRYLVRKNSNKKLALENLFLATEKVSPDLC